MPDMATPSHALTPSEQGVTQQMKVLGRLASKAKAARSREELESVREEVIDFHADLGPEDDTYNLVVNSDLDSQTTNLLVYCDQKLLGREDVAESYFPRL